MNINRLIFVTEMWRVFWEVRTEMVNIISERGAHRPTICTWRSKFRIYMVSLQNYAGSRRQSH